MAPPDRPRRLVPVLVFHSVSDRAGRSVWTIDTAAFRRILAAVAESGRRGVAFGALAESLRGGAPAPERAVVITFDDGFADNLGAAAACADHGLPATVFVTTGYLGRAEMLTPAGLRELAAMPGVEIGSHTVSHRRLDELPAREIARELRDSRELLEQGISRPVATVAYPHGNYDRRVLRIAEQAGYRGGAAVRMATAHDGDHPLAVARYIVSAATGMGVLRGLLAGDVPTRPRRERVVTRGYRVARRTRALVRPAAPTPPVP